MSELPDGAVLGLTLHARATGLGLTANHPDDLLESVLHQVNAEELPELRGFQELPGVFVINSSSKRGGTACQVSDDFEFEWSNGVQ